MIQRMKSTCFLAGLCSLGLMSVQTNEVEAATSAITITGGYKPGGGDPLYLYVFDVTLNAPDSPGTNTFTTNDFFKIDGLPGITSGSLTSAPPTSPGSPPFDVAWVPTITDLNQSPPDASDVAWTFVGTHVYSASTPGGPATQFLGEFQVLSTYDFPAGTVPFPSGTEFTYTFSIDGRTGGGTSTFPIIDLSVPEPSSALMLAVGTAGMLLVWLRQRQRPRQLHVPR